LTQLTIEQTRPKDLLDIMFATILELDGGQESKLIDLQED